MKKTPVTSKTSSVGKRRARAARLRTILILLLGFFMIGGVVVLASYTKLNMDARSQASVSYYSTMELDLGQRSFHSFDVIYDNSHQQDGVKYVSLSAEVQVPYGPANQGNLPYQPYQAVFAESGSGAVPTANPSPLTTSRPTPMPSPLPSALPGKPCWGQCAGDGSQREYPAGTVCLGQDGLCYACEAARAVPDFQTVPADRCQPPAPSNEVVIATQGEIALVTDASTAAALKFGTPVIRILPKSTVYSIQVSATAKSTSDPTVQQILRQRALFFRVKYTGSPDKPFFQTPRLTRRSIKGIRPKYPLAVELITNMPLPTVRPTVMPTVRPTSQPTRPPSPRPTLRPTSQPRPTMYPSMKPQPTVWPTVKPTPKPSPSVSYRLDRMPTTAISLSLQEPNKGYGVYVLLKDQLGKVVTNQSDFTYSWIPSTPAVSVNVVANCIFGQQSPCPRGNATFKPQRAGTAKVTVSVVQNSTKRVVAQTSFDVTVK